jgi:hypothetical protein
MSSLGGTSSGNIFDLTKAHIAAFDLSATTTCADYFPDEYTVATAEFGGLIDVALPEEAAYVAHSIPTSSAAISADVQAPVYTGSYEDITAIALSDITAAIQGAYYLPDTLPDDIVDAPNLGYPVAGFLSILDSAGLVTHDTPTVTVGHTPSFEDIPSISYDLSEISPFEEVIPSIPDLPEDVTVSSPEKLSRTVTPALLAAIDEGLAGNVALPLEAQEIIIARAKRLTDVKTDRAERQLFSEAAAAGAVDAPGGLIGRLSDLLHDASFEDRKVFEAMRDEVYKRAHDRMVAAVKSAMVLEKANLGIHLSYAAKLVETLQFNVAARVQYANLLIAMFNESLKAVRTIVSAYDQYASTVVAEYEAKSSIVERENAVLETNAAKLTVQEAQQSTISVQADLYGTAIKQNILPLKEFQLYVSGILKNVDIVRTNLSAFREANKVYEEAITADVGRIEGYASQVRATGSATGVYDANWDAYRVAQSAEEASNVAQRSWYSSSLQALSAEISEFQAAAQAQRTYTSTLVEWARANASMHTQYGSALATEVSYTDKFNSHLVALQQSASNIELAAEDVSVRVEALEAQSAALQASINIGLEAAKATTASGCAQAAYGVRSISAGMRASAGMSDAGSATSTVRSTTSTRRAYTYNKTRELSA